MPRSKPILLLPPPILYVAAFLLSIPLERYLPSLTRPQSGPLALALSILAFLLIAAGVILGPVCALRFLRKKTTLNPNREASEFFNKDVYLLSRNPMYLGLVLIYVGIAIVAWKPWALATLLIPFVAMDRVVIPYEEKQMARRFGKQYDDYRSKVRRWVTLVF